MTPEERAEIERLEKLCADQEREIERLKREEQALHEKIAEYKNIFYGEEL